MKIVDTFLFSEPSEKDLLLTKLNLENDIVSEWIILESPYSFQGEHKGTHAKTLLQNDPEFEPFLHKIMIICPDENFKPLHNGDNQENLNFDRENAQRAMCLGYVLNKYSEEDWVMISDTDECIDFSDESRKAFVLNLLNNNDRHIFKLRRQRYWYDFDNICYLPNIHIPLVRVGLLSQNHQYINARHFDHIEKVNPENPVAFEYSYCFRSYEDVWRKKCTYSHTGFTPECVRIALECNHWPRSDKRGERVGQEPYDFFEKVKLTENNSPKFVRDNLYRLQTNIVNADYKNRRKERYGV